MFKTALSESAHGKSHMPHNAQLFRAVYFYMYETNTQKTLTSKLKSFTFIHIHISGGGMHFYLYGNNICSVFKKKNVCICTNEYVICVMNSHALMKRCDGEPQQVV